MATTDTPEENHYNWRHELQVEQRVLQIYQSLGMLLERLKNTDSLPSIKRIRQLMQGLYDLRCNQRRWRSSGCLDQLILRSHLAFTMFVPGGKADKAMQAVHMLRTKIAWNAPGMERWWDDASQDIRPLVRFYRTKLHRLRKAFMGWDRIRTAATTLGQQGMYEWLQANVKGMGPKAAAHFMRNTGLSTGKNALPIIDVHIHKALEALGYPHDTYVTASQSFQNLAEDNRLDPLLLDAVLWCAYARNWDLDNLEFGNWGETEGRFEDEISEIV